MNTKTKRERFVEVGEQSSNGNDKIENLQKSNKGTMSSLSMILIKCSKLLVINSNC